jgi:hypothetical protein
MVFLMSTLALLSSSPNLSAAQDGLDAGILSGGVSDQVDVKTVTLVTQLTNGQLLTRIGTPAEYWRCGLDLGNFVSSQGIYYDSVRTANLALVSRCAELTEVGKSIDISTDPPDECKPFNDISDQLIRLAKGLPWNVLCCTTRGHIRHRIVRKLDGVHLGLHLRFHFGPQDSQNQALILDTARSCIPFISNIWGRYGIKLDLVMDSATAPISSGGTPIADVELSDTKGRATSSQFYLRGQDDGEYSQGELLNWRDSSVLRKVLLPPTPIAPDQRRNAQAWDFCKTVVHETGHILGLTDEYPYEICPNPEVSRDEDPWSFMDNQFRNSTQIEFFPRHLRRILSPLCPNIAR